jgi:acrylyl-CoA reductase (NADPH)/3-hydroxypropionyl-CoA dehydratase/3-hydroxypropionyl-CoA synthetase
MMNEAIETRQIEVTEPLLVPWKGLPATHQAMWENRHAGASYVVNHALPRPGIKTRDALYEAWAMEL